MKCIFLFKLSILCLLINSAQAAMGVCENLGKYSCSNGVIDDGTGTVRRFTFDDLEKMTQIVAQTGKPLKNEFLKKLRDPQNRYFRMLATSAFGLSAAPTCDRKNASFSDSECEQKVADELTMFSKSKAFGMTKLDTDEAFRNAGSRQFLSEKFLLTSNDTFKEVLDQYEQSIDQQLNTKATKDKISKTIFPEVKKQMIAKLRRMNLQEDARELMIAKIDAAKYDPSDCSGESRLDKYFEPNANSNPYNGRVEVCSSLLRMGDSEFMLASVLAHELAHQIDPCNVAIGPESHKINYKDNGKLDFLDSQYPVQGLIYCLRSKKSVGAINQLKLQRDQEAAKSAAANPNMNGSAMSGVVFGGTGQYSNQYSFPNPYAQAESADGSNDQGVQNTVEELADMNDGFSYCAQKQDQIGESVCDWFAAEILPEYISARFPNLTTKQWQDGAANAMRPICRDSSSTEFSVHPDTILRINAIYTMNPKVREKMQCSGHSKYSYCDANNPDKLLRDFGPVATKKPERNNPYKGFVLPNGPGPYGGSIGVPVLPNEQETNGSEATGANPGGKKGGIK